MKYSMKRKKVLITGASRGLGFAIAEKLAVEYDLILHATKEGSFKKEIPNSTILCADFTDDDAINNFCKELKKQFGEDLYAVINNAGITLDKSIIFQPEREINAMLSVNLKAPIMISKVAMKMFNRSKKGVIINISSILGESGNAFQSVYAATKAGLVAFSKSLAKEAGALNDEHEIRVLCVSPGYIQTDMTDLLAQSDKEKYMNAIPSKRFGRVEDVAETISFLLSEKASYINGTNIHINGGLI